MKKITLLLLLLSQSLLMLAQDKLAYQLFNPAGEKINYGEMLAVMDSTDILCFGELHNNPIAHWLQLELTKDLYTKKANQLVLGAEMFETDNQLLIDEYLQGQISEKNFEQEARLWPNHKTDYKPLLTFAKVHQLKFIASNVPRRYASMVYKKGLKSLDSLSTTAKQYLAPLPIPFDIQLKSYQSMMTMMEGMGDHPTWFPKAQAIKDATMAHFISQSWQKGQFFLHFNGSFHSDDHEGIVWYLKKIHPSAKLKTITTVSQTAVDQLEEEYLGKADFILCVPASMTTTY
ncbi:MAG: ChaN family lipoprotein [Saprospiraceae bacterium]